MVRSGVTLLAVLLLLSGTPQPAGTSRTFEDDAAQAVRTWRTSGAAQRWDDGLLPLGELSAMPPKVLRRIERDEEFGWKVAGPLPATPADAQVRWDDGTTRRVPVIGARQAMLEHSPWEGGDSGHADDESHHLTGATFTTMRLRTLRGMATVPAWRLRFSDLPGTIDQVAVDWDALGRLGDLVGEHVGGGGVSGFEALDERTLLVRYGYGACGHEPLDVRVRVSEHSDVVVLGTDVPDQGGGMCAGVGMSGEGVVGLEQPLGNRVVLSAGSGLPVLCGRMPVAC
ncbi:hypothetical protein HD597_011105 [Nonomuraea thailandensis]|uniref:Secreted protein n=1 Tax=Nonomuraea thailandensis TaxID=1188745 RepID=A0A9X2GUD7_9ACTN|nr:hypothetical protein [Nonomuraea thailandensis]MCP2364085.1 hypothetical protein [Nonomuraea thailandensis]